MNKPAVSKAQLRRAVETLEGMGKTVEEVVLRPDGTWQVRLTASERPAELALTPEDDFTAWAAKHGYN